MHPVAPEAGDPHHLPVMLEEAVTALAIRPGGVYLDGTFGAGGYTKAILATDPSVKVIAIDRDPDALRAGRRVADASGGRLTLLEGTFGRLDELAATHGSARLDGIVLDIGVSSMQLDEAERGFSFRQDGPLDMRMARQGLSAADIVNRAEADELADIFFHYGEERRSRAVARAILAARAESPIETTKRLAEIIASVVRAEPGGIHPATRSFQGLRIAVNDELGELQRALHAAERALAPGGRLAIVTFHSLEDRIVKQFLARRAGRAPSGSRHAPTAREEVPTFALVGKQPVAPSQEETRRNPRARSAKLRVAERLDTPARAPDAAIVDLSALPSEARRGEGRTR